MQSGRESGKDQVAAHQAAQLWEGVDQAVGPYPDGVLRVPAPLQGTAFFPGGYGLWREGEHATASTIPVHGAMCMGQDFHSKQGYEDSLRRGTEWPHVRTWRSLIAILEEAPLPPTQCFFTNGYMGLRESDKATGRFPGLLDGAFVKRCHQFLIHQIDVQQPRLIVTLGKAAFQALGAVSGSLTRWRDARNYRELDAVGAIQSCRFANGVNTTAVALLHPSLRTPSLRHRRWNGLEGHEAEIGLLREGMRRAGLPEPLNRPQAKS